MTAQAPVRALERLRASPRPRVLFVTHGHGGGVARHVADLAAMIAGEAEALVLQPHAGDLVALREVAGVDPLALGFAPAEWESLIRVLEAIGIDRLHFHHVHGLPRAVLDLPARLGVGYDVTLHDHFPVCPAYHLRDGAGRYCGGAPGCVHCLESGPACWDVTIAEWRGLFARFLAMAARVIAPSAATARQLAAHFPGLPVRVWPHPEAPSEPFTAPLRVLVPGAISPAKGLALLQDCARDAEERRLPLHFRVLGYVAHTPGERLPGPVSITGEYAEGALAPLIALERGDVAFFPAQCPETFSYTLSAVLDTALPVVATDLGALPERLAGRANARILPWDTPPARFNDALLEAAPARTIQPQRAIAPVTFDDYRARYRADLPAGTRGPSRPLADAAGSGGHALPEWRQTGTLEFLFEDGVRCGRRASLEALERAVREADARIAAADAREAHAAAGATDWHARLAACEAQKDRLAAEAAQRRAEAERACAAGREMQERLHRLEGSRSWRVTAPLRALARWWARRA